MTKKREFDLIITCMTADKIGRHKVLYQLTKTMTKFKKEISL